MATFTLHSNVAGAKAAHGPQQSLRDTRRQCELESLISVRFVKPGRVPGYSRRVRSAVGRVAADLIVPAA
jgi:hypothetical protein